jgi:Polysulphide reductase, NrfD
MSTLAPHIVHPAPPIPGPQELITYHGRPALKPSLYGWTVGLYIFAGGLAGAVQILATAADLMSLSSSRGIILSARVIALAGAIIGGILLIIELHTRQRFFNMLRIFRPTSPMSIGTYVLMNFGFWSLLALILDLFAVHSLALICGCLAAVAGWFMTTYPASLLAATSTPLWAAAPRSLAVRFASSAMATGAATLCIVALVLGSPPVRAFGTIAIAALAVEFIASMVAQQIYRRKGINGPLRDPPLGPLHSIGIQFCGEIVPIALYLMADLSVGRPAILLLIASLLVLGGGVLMRGLMFLAGNESARRPQDYFRFAREA